LFNLFGLFLIHMHVKQMQQKYSLIACFTSKISNCAFAYCTCFCI